MLRETPSRISRGNIKFYSAAIFRTGFAAGESGRERETSGVIGRALHARGRDHTQLPAAAKEASYLSSLSRRYFLPLVYSLPLRPRVPGVSKASLSRGQDPGGETCAISSSSRPVSFRLVSSRLVSSQRYYVTTSYVSACIANSHRIEIEKE